MILSFFFVFAFGHITAGTCHIRLLQNIMLMISKSILISIPRCNVESAKTNLFAGQYDSSRILALPDTIELILLGNDRLLR